MDKDKTNFIDELPRLPEEEEITGSGDLTVKSSRYDTDQSLGMPEDSAFDKTALIFGKDDIRKKIQDELLEVPELGAEEMQSEYLSRLISKPFSHRTEEERLKINRNFLRDAEPLTLERLKEDIQEAADDLYTGFASLDRWISIPNRKFTIIASRPQHGKTMFLLNMLLNMTRKYPGHHFLYYSYGEARQDVELKLINMCGEKPFPPVEHGGIANNFKRWKYEFKNLDAKTLLERAAKIQEYKGLQNFLEISSRIHVMDANYNIMDLLDSLKAFNSTLPIGAVFIDCIQAVRPYQANAALTRQQQLQEVIDQLIEVSNEKRSPFILGAQMVQGEKNVPEYDGLNIKCLKDLKDPEQYASLIIALQNYAKSEFIGSNYTEHFTSRFFQYTLKKAERMPESFKDKHPNTVILAKVLVNRAGPTTEVELLFNKWLMRISDFDPGAKHLDQYDFLR